MTSRVRQLRSDRQLAETGCNWTSFCARRFLYARNPACFHSTPEIPSRRGGVAVPIARVDLEEGSGFRPRVPGVYGCERWKSCATDQASGMGCRGSCNNQPESLTRGLANCRSLTWSHAELMVARDTANELLPHYAPTGFGWAGLRGAELFLRADTVGRLRWDCGLAAPKTAPIPDREAVHQKRPHGPCESARIVWVFLEPSLLTHPGCFWAESFG